MSNTSASKTRSLTMTLIMVLMALSPMASVEADHDENWFGDYELHVNGTLYDQVEVPWPSDVDILSCTPNSWDDGWNCEIDIDGDGDLVRPRRSDSDVACVPRPRGSMRARAALERA